MFNFYFENVRATTFSNKLTLSFILNINNLSMLISHLDQRPNIHITYDKEYISAQAKIRPIKWRVKSNQS